MLEVLQFFVVDCLVFGMGIVIGGPELMLWMVFGLLLQSHSQVCVWVGRCGSCWWVSLCCLVLFGYLVGELFIYVYDLYEVVNGCLLVFWV